MKKLLLATLLSLCGTVLCYSQCVVYVCAKTGAWSAEFNNGKPPFETMDGLRRLAMKECEKQGGTDCRSFFDGNGEGKGTWWAFIIAHNSDHTKFNYMAIGNEQSKSSAEEALRTKFLNSGGYSTDIKVTSWYVSP